MIKGSFPTEEFKKLRTPFYYYDMELLASTLEKIRTEAGKSPEYIVHYAIKANFNEEILRAVSATGLGADCISGGEIEAALKGGFKPETIVYSGVGKSDAEIELGLEKGIGRFNVESEAELEVIDEIAGSLGKKARISFRVNPDIGAHGRANLTTGTIENKFGIDMEQLDKVVDRALSMKNVEFLGLHFHIGTQLTDMSDFVILCNRINDLQQRFLKKGISIADINVGGGLGIEYLHPNHLPQADFESYFNVFRTHLKTIPGQKVHFELGRSVVAPCGSLISRVLYVKEGISRKFAIIDGSMTELIRPALYHAYHRIENISSDGDEETYDVVGPVCESTDIFARRISLDKCRRGDFIAIRSAGAYCESMASRYNCRPLPGSFFGKKKK